MLLSTAFVATALSYLASAAPVRRSLWTTQTCTGDSSGDIAMGADIPTVMYSYLTSSIKSEQYFTGSGNDSSINYKSLCTSQNDTSVIVVSEGASLTLNNVNLLKYGYTSDLNQASFYGVNAILNVANDSSLTAHHVNMTAHNGAAGIYSYGTGTVVTASHSSFYATGPVSHGLYASGNGTINATNFYCETYGYRSSCYSGDGPAGYLTVKDSEAFTYGHGSAVMYTLGQSYLENVHGYADLSPWTFMDGNQEIIATGSDLEGGYLAGVVLFSSGDYANCKMNATNSILRVHGSNAAAIAVGGTGATIGLESVIIQSESGLLLASNTSTIPQSFLEWSSPEDAGKDIDPAGALVTITKSIINGDIVAINGSTIDWNLQEHSAWTGAAVLDNIVATGAIGVYLDATSSWTLTADATLQNFTVANNELINIESNGFSIYYNSSAAANSWLNGATKALSGGGSLAPMS